MDSTGVNQLLTELEISLLNFFLLLRVLTIIEDLQTKASSLHVEIY